MLMPIEPIFWNWLILTCVFLLLEIFSVSFFFILWAMASAILAVITVYYPEMSFPLQALCFAGLSIISISMWWFVARKWQKDAHDEAAKLNNRGKNLIGRQFVLETPIAQGQGRLNIDDSLWVVRGQDMPAGTLVVVANVDSAQLDVVRAQ